MRHLSWIIRATGKQAARRYFFLDGRSIHVFKLRSEWQEFLVAKSKEVRG